MTAISLSGWKNKSSRNREASLMEHLVTDTPSFCGLGCINIHFLGEGYDENLGDLSKAGRF